MRIRRQTASLMYFVAEITELLGGKSAFEKSPRVNAGGSVALEIDLVAAELALRGAEKMVETNFIQGGGGGISRNMAANAAFIAIGAYHHSHRIPADQTFDAPLDLAAAGERRLLGYRDGVNIGRVGGKGQLDPGMVCALLQFQQQFRGALRAAGLEHVIQRFQPLLQFNIVQVWFVYGRDIVAHADIPLIYHIL